MKTIVGLFHAFDEDDSGAAFIEYTALLGVILVVAITVLTSVGTWANGRWNQLNSSLSANP